MNKLLLMRHGTAQMQAPSDAGRALTVQGEAEARKMGAWLAATVPEITTLIHSPYKRACQTAAEVGRFFPALKVLEFDGLIPHGRPVQVVEYLAGLADDCCLCVTHQPLVGDLRNLLVEGATAGGYPFSTAAVSLLEYEYLAAGCASEAWMHGPSDVLP